MSLACTQSGPAGGRPVVLLHGFPLDGAMWNEQRDALARAGMRVLVPDLPGAGKSPVASTVSMDSVADAVAQTMDQHGVARATVVGFSMGGYVALAFAANHAARLERLVLVDTRAGADTPEGRTKRLATLASVQQEGVASLVKAMLPGMFTPQTWAIDRARVEAVRQMMLRQDPRGVAAFLQAMADRPDRHAILPTVQAPTMVIVGSEDPITPPDAARKMADEIPAARLEVVEGAAHLTPMERPDAVNRLLLGFLEAVAGRDGTDRPLV